MLTQLQAQNAKPKAKPYMLADGKGLHLHIKPSGSKLWRFRYRFESKANMLGFGNFPEVSIATARTMRDEAREQLRAGIDPSLKKKLDKIAGEETKANTFGYIALEFLARIQAQDAAPATLKKTKWMLEVLAAPLSKRPITEIKPAEILDILQKVEKSGRRDTAHRLRGVIGSVFRYAIATLRAETDPTYALRGALLKVKVKHRAAVTDEKQLGILWQQIDEHEGWPVLRSALKFLVLTFQRPGDIRHLHRTEIDFAKKVWHIPAERMKMRRPHDVPLSLDTSS